MFGSRRALDGSLGSRRGRLLLRRLLVVGSRQHDPVVIALRLAAVPAAAAAVGGGGGGQLGSGRGLDVDGPVLEVGSHPANNIVIEGLG